MSSSVAPRFPATSIFIPAYWENARGELLTQDEADTRYLKFPIGQGTESIPNLIVAGTTTLGITSATAPSTGDNTTRVPTTSWVNTAITNAGGSYVYTATTSLSSSTTIPFNNCFASNLYGVYDIYFVFAIGSFTAYPTITMTWTGINTPTYVSYKTTTTGTTGTPTIANSVSNTNGYAWFADSFFAGAGSLTNATFNLKMWGAKSISGGAGSMVFQYSGENYAISNPGATGLVKTYGYVAPTSGYPTGITLTSSSALTGSVSIFVSSQYS